MQPEKLISGRELRQLIKDLSRGACVYLYMEYSAGRWTQRWPRAAALRLASELERVRKSHSHSWGGCCKNCSACVVQTKRGLYISCVLK